VEVLYIETELASLEKSHRGTFPPGQHSLAGGGRLSDAMALQINLVIEETAGVLSFGFRSFRCCW
jgi:hypothetical protein